MKPELSPRYVNACPHDAVVLGVLMQLCVVFVVQSVPLAGDSSSWLSKPCLIINPSPAFTIIFGLRIISLNPKLLQLLA